MNIDYSSEKEMLTFHIETLQMEREYLSNRLNKAKELIGYLEYKERIIELYFKNNTNRLSLIVNKEKDKDKDKDYSRILKIYDSKIKFDVEDVIIKDFIERK